MEETPQVSLPIKDALRQARLYVTRAMANLNWQDKVYKDLNDIAEQLENMITSRKQ